jgi:carbonic anhydrase
MGLTRRELGSLLGMAAIAGLVEPRRAAADEVLDGVCQERGVEAAELWGNLVSGNRRFVAGTPAEHALVDVREQLAAGQRPRVVVLGCSDSRVGPETVFDSGLGELFVVRSAGNVVDPVGLGSIEYAIKHHHPKLLVVLGHQDCGMVEAALDDEPMSSPSLQALMRRIAPSVEMLRDDPASDERLQRAVEANVRQSARDLVTYSSIVGDAVSSGKVALVQTCYRLASGEVVRMA